MTAASSKQESSGAGESEISANIKPKWQLPSILKIIAMLREKNNINWIEEKKSFRAAYADLWRNRKFMLRNYFHPDLIIAEQHQIYAYYYQHRETALNHLIFFKLLSAGETAIDFIQSCQVLEKKDDTLYCYYFSLDNATHQKLAKMRAVESLSKSVRADDKCFIKQFTHGITPTPTKPGRVPLRPYQHRCYTVYHHGVAIRSNKESPYIVSGQVANKVELAQKKSARSRHQSTSLLNFTLPIKIFRHATNHHEATAGFIFDRRDALLNRIGIYTGATRYRPYEFSSSSEAQNYYDKTVTCFRNKSRLPTLFASTAELCHAVKSTDQLTEITACLRFDINTTAIAIFNDNFESRCIARFYADIMQQRLIQQYQEQRWRLPENYRVPILFVLPDDHPKCWSLYDEQQRQEDNERAMHIVKNNKKREHAFQLNQFAFLLLLDEPDHIFDLHYQHLPILVWLFFYKGHIEVAEYLFERTTCHQLKKQSFASYLQQNRNFARLPNITNDKTTVLHHVASRGYLHLFLAPFHSILKHNISSRNAALNDALLYRHHDVAKLIIHAMIEDHLKAARPIPQTTLMSAANIGDAVSIKPLIKAGCHINYQDKDRSKKTALMDAARSGHDDIIRQLLGYRSVNISLRDAHGYSALDYACRNNHAHIVALLIAKGAKPWEGSRSRLMDYKDALGIAAHYNHRNVLVVILNYWKNIMLNPPAYFYGPQFYLQEKPQGLFAFASSPTYSRDQELAALDNLIVAISNYHSIDPQYAEIYGKSRLLTYVAQALAKTELGKSLEIPIPTSKKESKGLIFG